MNRGNLVAHGCYRFPHRQQNAFLSNMINRFVLCPGTHSNCNVFPFPDKSSLLIESFARAKSAPISIEKTRPSNGLAERVVNLGIHQGSSA